MDFLMEDSLMQPTSIVCHLVLKVRQQLYPRALFLRHVLWRMSLDLCHGVQLHRSGSSLGTVGKDDGETQALP